MVMARRKPRRNVYKSKFDHLKFFLYENFHLPLDKIELIVYNNDT